MKLAKVLVFAACLVPAALLVRGFMINNLGVNPVETITHTTGNWTLRFLLISLCITPARKLLRKTELLRFRRMLGLFAFVYAFLHFMTWAWLDQELEFRNVLGEIRKRPFITAGAVSLFTMVPLAVTSTSGWIRRLGGKRWQLLHQAVYLSALAGVVHYWWLVKSDIRLPAMYGAIFLALMFTRWWMRRRVPVRA
jgi:sulfoxide reductase heme-binding subunit YedZ